MTQVIRAHFDGEVIVPEEAVSVPANTPLKVGLEVITPEDEAVPAAEVIEERLKKVAPFIGCISGPSLPPEAFDRGSLYD